MSSPVNLGSLSGKGQEGQVFVRHPDNSDGGTWQSGFFVFVNQATGDFGSSGAPSQIVTVTVGDGGVNFNSIVQASVQLAQGRASDEMELDPVDVSIGAITPGRSIDIILSPGGPGSLPNGQYLVNYARA